MPTKYDDRQIVIHKYILIKVTKHVFINYEFVSSIICEHGKSVFINYDCVSIIMCKHDTLIFTN